MNKKAILASLVVAASSTAALADPYVVQAGAQVEATVAPTATVTVRDHRDADDQVNQMPRDVDGQWMQNHRRLPVWSVLSSSDRLSNGKATIFLGGWKKYSEIRLAATKGTFDISRVQIKFRDGSSSVLRMDGDLSPQSPALTINLDGYKAIASIKVFGTSSGRRAQFEILGA